MSQIEYTDFPKFLVSLGIFLIALPILSIYFFLQENSVLLITNTDLSNLTETAQETILLKQALSLKLTAFFFPIAGGCFLIGGFLLFFGGKMWYKNQKTIESKQSIELELAKLNLQNATLEERDEALQQDVVEMTANYVDSSGGSEENTTESIKTDTNTNREVKPSEEQEEDKLVFKEMLNKYKMIEDAVIERIQHILRTDYDVHPYVRVQNTYYDVIAISRVKSINYIFEIKYLSSIYAWNSDKLASIVQKMIVQHKMFSSYSSRKINLVLLIVTPDDQMDIVMKTLSMHFKQNNISIPIKIIPENKISSLDKNYLLSKKSFDSISFK